MGVEELNGPIVAIVLNVVQELEVVLRETILNAPTYQHIQVSCRRSRVIIVQIK